MANAANPDAPLTAQGPDSSPPSLLGIFPRVIMITFGITGISFAVSLFVGILCMAMMGMFRGHFPDMRLAYRMFALPVAAMVGSVALIVASSVEVRHYLQSKRLNSKNLDPKSLNPKNLNPKSLEPGRWTENPSPKIAIPIPKSDDPDYSDRALPQYERAVRDAGGLPVRIPLDQTPAEAMKLISHCDGVLLPGSGADIDPAKYGAERDPETAPPDPKRDTIDELLLQDAYNMRKPVLAICYGLQMLNVYRSGTLIQHIPRFLPADKKDLVNHEAGRKVEYAHQIVIEQQSKLARIAGASEIPANSSHHQSAGEIGDGLRVVARSKEDGIVEALEGTSPGHFVLAVQWHPERSTSDAPSRALFTSLVEAARARHLELQGELESV